MFTAAFNIQGRAVNASLLPSYSGLISGDSGTLSVIISPASVIMDFGQPQLFTSAVSGGTPTYTYQWYLNGAIVVNATSSSWTFTPGSFGSHPTSFDVYVNVTDNVGVTVKSNIVSVTANPSLSVTVSPSSAVMDVGQSQLFNSTVSGGTLPYKYQWCLNETAVSGATSSTWTFTPTSAGSYTVYSNVTDSLGAQATSNTATVTASTVPEFPLDLILLLFIIVILLLIVSVTLVLHYTRGSETQRDNPK
jgi:hypothetical protein